MNISPINEIRKRVNEKRKQFNDACRDVFGNGEQMSSELAAYGVEASPVTCRSWMNGKTHPSIITAHAILAIIEIKDEQRIAKARARIAAVRAL